MTRKRVWAAAAPLFFLLAPAVAFDADFSFYPTNSQNCLNQAAASSKCSGATAKDLNSCLCTNGGNFVISAATCLGKDDSSDVVTVFETMTSACANSGTPLTTSPNDFYAAAKGQLKTTTSSSAPTSTAHTTTSKGGTTVTVTPTSTSTDSSSSSSDNQGPLSTGATVGIALGASIGGVAAIAGLVLFLRKKKKRGEESHPMLPRYSGSGPTTFPPTEPSPGFSPFGSEGKRPAWASSTNPSPDPSWRNSGNVWGSSQTFYQGAYPPPEGVAELAPQTTQVFEMPGSLHPAPPIEMAGSLPPPPASSHLRDSD